MRECSHERFDFSQPSGNGYVRCADCGKSIPVERALIGIDRRIMRLEKALLKFLDEEATDASTQD
jgi:ribosomal protein S26